MAWYLLFGLMAVYYAYRMFAFTPWYDELYTYYFFISKGPVYAAIHWPLPNNHVGYSVLSAFLDYLGNPYIGLRGVSYLCALANMVLIYKISKTALKNWLPFCTVIFYVSVGLVNQMAVQGRGYTLGVTCCLLAFYCMTKICGEKKAGKRVYICYAASLTLALYAVSSNVYWVIPLCLSGGIYLLIGGLKEAGEESRGKSGEKKVFFLKTARGKKLIRLVGASLCAALGTVLLYASIWVSIGSNLLVKEEGSPYYGLGHIKTILQAPFAAMGRGMRYMLDTPYIQSEERAGFAGRLWEWLKSLASYYYVSLSLPIVIICIAGAAYLLYKTVKSIKKGTDAPVLLYLFLILGILLIPVMLLIQCKRPYYRVFTYGGLLVALLLGVLLQDLQGFAADRIQEGKGKKLVFLLPAILAIAIGVKCFIFSGYNEQYGEREHEIAEAFRSTDLSTYENLCVTDCNQEYLLYFLYGIRCENREIEGADAVLLDRRMCEPDFDEMVWEFYHYYDSIPWDYMKQNMAEAYENKDYILYIRKS
ncbi:MAG: glycosyltransferase family 39 protein [Clostridium sp.]|nr:glycosyltransferase family 39 protein [Clostridium sp.]